MRSFVQSVSVAVGSQSPRPVARDAARTFHPAVGVVSPGCEALEFLHAERIAATSEQRIA